MTRFGWRSLGDYPGGVWFCDLAQSYSMDGVVHAVAQGLNVPLAKGDPVAQIGHAIAGRNRCLVILDNFEQVVAHAPATLGRWLDRAVEASFVITTRERLHLPGESLVRRAAFACDGSHRLVRDTRPGATARLQNQRRQSYRRGGSRASPRRPATCYRVSCGTSQSAIAGADCRPLGGSLSPTSCARGVAGRQATLRAAIDWSWGLLAPWEQVALAQFSAFEGGFTLRGPNPLSI